MSATSLPYLPIKYFWQVIIIASAVLCGGMIAILPIEQGIILFGGILLVILALVTPFSALIFLLIIAPLRVLMQTEAPLQLPLDIGQLGFLLLVGVWGIHRITQRKKVFDFVYTPLYAPIAFFLIVAGFGVFHAGSLSTWLTEWLKWAVILTLIFLIFSLCRYNQRWQWAVFGVISAGAGHAIIGIYTFWGGSGADHLVIDAGRGIFRAFGTFGQPNPFGGFMGLLAPLAIMMVVGYGGLAWRNRHLSAQNARLYLFLCIVYAMAGLLICVGVIASWSRGAWLGLGLSMLVLLVAFPRKLWHGVAFLSVVMLVGGMLWLSGMLPKSVTERIGSATQELFVLTDVRGVDISPENYAIIERLAHWQAALNMARENAWLGVGFGNYDFAYESHRLINWKFSLGHAHNYYLNVLAETGIIGLIAYLGVFVSLLVITWKTRQHPDFLSRTTAIGLLGSWVYLATHSMTDNLYVNNVFIHFGVMIGILAVLNHPLIIRKKVKIS